LEEGSEIAAVYLWGAITAGIRWAEKRENGGPFLRGLEGSKWSGKRRGKSLSWGALGPQTGRQKKREGQGNQDIKVKT